MTKKLLRFAFFAAIFLLIVEPVFCDEIYGYYAEWKSARKAEGAAADKKFIEKLEKFETTRDFEVFKVQQPSMAQALLQMKAELATGGGAKIDDLVAFYLEEREIISLKNQRYIFCVLFVLVVVLLLLLFFMFGIVLFNEKKRVAREVFSELEKERSRISFELHDAAAQEIHGAILALKANEKPQEILPILENSQKEIRRICSALNPPALEMGKLENLLGDLCRTFENNTKIPCAFSLSKEDLLFKRNLNIEQRISIYRIVQEALANVEKHSEATSTQVVFRSAGGNRTVFFISDDGKSFDVKNSEKEGHFGLKSIRQRVVFLNGDLKITSEPEIGTEIRVEF